jgi:hypothetical protein
MLVLHINNTLEPRLYDIQLYDVLGWSWWNSVTDCSRTYSVVHQSLIRHIQLCDLNFQSARIRFIQLQYMSSLLCTENWFINCGRSNWTLTSQCFWAQSGRGRREICSSVLQWCRFCLGNFKRLPVHLTNEWSGWRVSLMDRASAIWGWWDWKETDYPRQFSIYGTSLCKHNSYFLIVLYFMPWCLLNVTVQ